LIVIMLRATASRNWWSGRRAPLTHERQKCVVAAIRACASSTLAGDTRPSAQDSEQ
jgi:hypothetical protein